MMMAIQLICIALSVFTSSVAEALSLSARDRDTGLSRILAETNDEFFLDLVIDTEARVDVNELYFSVEWDGGPRPVLELVDYLQTRDGGWEWGPGLAHGQSSSNSAGWLNFSGDSYIGVTVVAPRSVIRLKMRVILASGGSSEIRYTSALARNMEGRIPITSTSGFTVTVIPEPSTALLIGLGLSGLAASRKNLEPEASSKSLT
jgi:hypothetical protein